MTPACCCSAAPPAPPLGHGRVGLPSASNLPTENASDIKGDGRVIPNGRVWCMFSVYVRRRAYMENIHITLPTLSTFPTTLIFKAFPSGGFGLRPPKASRTSPFVQTRPGEAIEGAAGYRSTLAGDHRGAGRISGRLRVRDRLGRPMRNSAEFRLFFSQARGGHRWGISWSSAGSSGRRSAGSAAEQPVGADRLGTQGRLR